MKKQALPFLILQLVILITIWFYYKEITLLGYINVSFIYGAFLLFIGLASYVLSSGFFDLFYSSSRKLMSFKKRGSDMEQMRNPSEIISYNFTFILLLGLEIIICMVIALIVYYQWCSRDLSFVSIYIIIFIIIFRRWRRVVLKARVFRESVVGENRSYTLRNGLLS